MIEGTRQAEEWLREAKARFGQALQRLQVARTKKAEFQRQAQQRQASGNPLTPQEMEVFNSKLAQCNKAITESQTFMEKFKAQQNEFRTTQPSQQYTKQEGQEQAQPPSQGGGQISNLQPGVGQGQGPQAHSISSAVSAAALERNRQQQAQAAQQGAGPSQLSHAGSPVNPNAASGQPGGTGATPIKAEASNASVFQTAAHGDGSQSAGPRPSSHGGMPHSALQQHPSSSSIHSHPLGNSINGTKPVTAQAITKNLQVSEPKPVQMPPARPTMNGGASVGLPGQLGQPAIATLPGYVLESSEDGRLLGKKKLNELVREIVGPGKEGNDGEESLTAETEEVSIPFLLLTIYTFLILSHYLGHISLHSISFDLNLCLPSYRPLKNVQQLFLQIADDFVDDLVSSACKLAKLRGSTTLENRDLQMVLERQYNIRIPGYSTDEVRTAKRAAPAQGWAQKMSAVGAAKVTGGVKES